MAKLQSTEIVGTTSVSNPPAGNACIWYDTAERALKVTFCGFTGGTWANRNSLATARYQLAGAGTQNVALAFGGRTSSFPYTTGATEAYNGSNWSGRNSLANGRYQLAGAGTQNAALAFGGGWGVTGATEAYNGSNWSTTNTMITSRRGLAGAGTQNAALAFGGGTPSITGATEAFTASTSFVTCTLA